MALAPGDGQRERRRVLADRAHGCRPVVEPDLEVRPLQRLERVHRALDRLQQVGAVHHVRHPAVGHADAVRDDRGVLGGPGLQAYQSDVARPVGGQREHQVVAGERDVHRLGAGPRTGRSDHREVAARRHLEGVRHVVGKPVSEHSSDGPLHRVHRRAALVGGGPGGPGGRGRELRWRGPPQGQSSRDDGHRDDGRPRGPGVGSAREQDRAAQDERDKGGEGRAAQRGCRRHQRAGRAWRAAVRNGRPPRSTRTLPVRPPQDQSSHSTHSTSPASVLTSRSSTSTSSWPTW